MLKASVIISTYNLPNYLKLVLNALKDQDVSDFEIIIADDGSKPDTRALIADMQPNFPIALHHVWQDDIGFRVATIRNKAAAISKGEYLIFIDGDCIPLTNFVRRHIALAEKNWFISGKRSFANKRFTNLVLANKVSDIHKFTLWQLFRLCCNHYCNRFFSFIYLPFNKIRKIRPTKWKGAQTCNLAVWKSDFIAINGFDEIYNGWGYEDSDLVIRLIRNGTFRKNGNYATSIVHLWHEANDKSSILRNKTLLNEILKSNRIRAKIGMDQYI